MPNKRKDNKGRLLRTGESQRKDLTYMYRYTDMRGKRQCVYADDLNKLREKEKKIQLDTLQGLDISGGGNHEEIDFSNFTTSLRQDIYFP